MGSKSNDQFTRLQGLTAPKALTASCHCWPLLLIPHGLDLMALFLMVMPPFPLHSNSDMHPSIPVSPSSSAGPLSLGALKPERPAFHRVSDSLRNVPREGIPSQKDTGWTNLTRSYFINTTFIHDASMLKSHQGLPVAWELGMRGPFTGASLCLGRFLGEKVPSLGRREVRGNPRVSLPQRPHSTWACPPPNTALQWLPIGT